MGKIKKIFKKCKIDKVYKVGRIFIKEGYSVLRYKVNYALNERVEGENLSDYQKWIVYNKNNKPVEIKSLEYRPCISVVIPVYNVKEDLLRTCIESVMNQSYDNWQLCMADDCSTWECVHKVLKEYEDHPKVKIVYRKENGHISRSTNSAIALADGEFIAFMDCDDIITKDALYEVALKLNENPKYDFIYSDEDKINEAGTKRTFPHFKPDWSPDTLMTMMYTSHLGVYRTSIVKEIGGLRVGFEGSQDYDFTLRFTEKTNIVGHIPKVLYHWREIEGSTSMTPEAKPYVFEAQKNAKIEALSRRGLSGAVVYQPKYYQMRVIYDNPTHPKVSIVIPSKDNPSVYQRCIETLHKITAYPNYEVIQVDNGSSKENRAEYETINTKFGQKYHYEEMDFNFSTMCNIGAAQTDGEYILFLNDDIEIIDPTWLDKMVGQASPEYVGAVGAKLYYPDSEIIQHCGVININDEPVHLLVGHDDKNFYYFGRNVFEYNVLAVTGACLLVDRKKFQKVGGFNEKFAVAYNDIDLCMALLEAGYYNVVRNDAILYHHESLSRGKDTMNQEKMKRLKKERERLFIRHPQYRGKDPFYSSNLTQASVNCTINVEGSVDYNEIHVLDKMPYRVAGNIIAAFDVIRRTEYLYLQGFAYYSGKRFNNKRKAKVIVECEGKILEVETRKIYRPDLQNRNDAKGYVALTGFECAIALSELMGKECDLRIVLEDKMTRVLNRV